jgi:hypothetical protein
VLLDGLAGHGAAAVGLVAGLEVCGDFVPGERDAELDADCVYVEEEELVFARYMEGGVLAGKGSRRMGSSGE